MATIENNIKRKRVKSKKEMNISDINNKQIDASFIIPLW